MEKFADIIEKIKNQKIIDPPESFADHVMRQLPDQYPGILFAAASFVHHLYNHALALDGDGSNGLTSRECSFYFFITGFFYMIIGIILMMGLQGIGSSMAAMEWIGLQPHLTIGAAIWLLALGVLLMLNGSVGIKAARYGTMFYVFFAVVNGILMRQYLHVPFAGVFIIGFVATSAFMGVMLSRAVKKVELRTV
ncbi:MAG: hypothetical protein NTX36_01685 [Proteobacteria bacterium]|nr:hypothetical protein [Pseudomonadota bacterium]